jgi:parallel beta-helix repeat protein
MYFINSNSNSIEGNIMNNSNYGIRLDNSNNNIITGNDIKSGSYAIWLHDSNDNTISENNISGGKAGIRSGGGDRTNISQNHIYNSGKGIWLSNGNYDIVSNNYLLNNDEGISLFSCYKTNIINNEIVASKSCGFISIYNMYININRNNFIDNDKNAYFCLHFPSPEIRLNNWNNNYWGETHRFFYKINGEKYYDNYFPLLNKYIEFNFTWYNFDWKPAQEPYEIGV